MKLPRPRPSPLRAAAAVSMLVFLASCGLLPAGSSSPLPEESCASAGQIMEGVDVPEAVLEAAMAHAESVRASWDDPGSSYAGMAGGAGFDDWRIEGLELVDHYDALEGRVVDVYRLDYRIHTPNPNAVMLAGGMELDQEGWLLPTSPGATYLVFAVEGEAPVFLCSVLIRDCEPGSEAFLEHLRGALS